VSGDIALANGQKGNIYSDLPQAKPVTSLLAVPSPWTSKGVGTAIPDSELGAEATFSTTAALAPAITPTVHLSFPPVPTTAEPTAPPIALNITAFPTLPTGSLDQPSSYGPPAISDAPSVSEPSGYGNPPAANMTVVEPSTGTARANSHPGLHAILCLVVLTCIAPMLQSSFQPST
jgi:hypothetical protein